MLLHLDSDSVIIFLVDPIHIRMKNMMIIYKKNDFFYIC